MGRRPPMEEGVHLHDSFVHKGFTVCIYHELRGYNNWYNFTIEDAPGEGSEGVVAMGRMNVTPALCKIAAIRTVDEFPTRKFTLAKINTS